MHTLCILSILQVVYELVLCIQVGTNTTLASMHALVCIIHACTLLASSSTRVYVDIIIYSMHTGRYSVSSIY